MTYDAESHLTSDASSGGCNSVGDYCTAFGYTYGPSGQPRLYSQTEAGAGCAGTGSGTLACVSGSDTFHWAGGQLLFVSDQSGGLVQENIESLGTYGDACSATVVWHACGFGVDDRDIGGFLAGQHNGVGTTGANVPPSSSYAFPGAGALPTPMYGSGAAIGAKAVTPQTIGSIQVGAYAFQGGEPLNWRTGQWMTPQGGLTPYVATTGGSSTSGGGSTMALSADATQGKMKPMDAINPCPWGEAPDSNNSGNCIVTPASAAAAFGDIAYGWQNQDNGYDGDSLFGCFTTHVGGTGAFGSFCDWDNAVPGDGGGLYGGGGGGGGLPTIATVHSQNGSPNQSCALGGYGAPSLPGNNNWLWSAEYRAGLNFGKQFPEWSLFSPDRGLTVAAAAALVGQGGKFDYQRWGIPRGAPINKRFVPASNFGEGVFFNAAGYDIAAVVIMGGGYTVLKGRLSTLSLNVPNWTGGYSWAKVHCHG